MQIGIIVIFQTRLNTINIDIMIIHVQMYIVVLQCYNRQVYN